MLRSVLRAELDSIYQQGLYRFLRELTPAHDALVVSEGKEYINFSSNNYLGLANDNHIVQVAKQALDRYGVGAGASRLISGNTPLHEQLERVIATFKHQQSAVVFPTGYMANSGVIYTLMNNKNDLIVVDRLVHASLIDACRSVPAQLRVYPHLRVDKLEGILKRYSRRRTLVVTDGVFSMDGDIAPLAELGAVARKYGAWLMVDDAHGTGVLGEHGRGSAELTGAEDLIHIHMGTLSKGCGVMGGYVAGASELREMIINKARSFIYTTGIPAVLCAASIEAINIIEQQPWRRERLSVMSDRIRATLRELGFSVGCGCTPIIPVIIGDHILVMEIARFLYDNGLIIPGIRYPTVHKGQARLRISLQATHSDTHIERLESVMKKVMAKYAAEIKDVKI